jgi:hypothetical protein
VIKDLKEGPWAHMPSGRFGANAAWLAFGAIAHNLARWSERLGKITDGRGPIALATLRRLHLGARAPLPLGSSPDAAPGKRLALGKCVPGRACRRPRRDAPC